MKLWHPHTERPDCLCACLIAQTGDLSGNGPPEPMLAADFYIYYPERREFRNERTDRRMTQLVFWWAKERDVLAELSGTAGILRHD